MKKIYMVLIHIFIIVGLILNIYQYNNHQAKSIINSTKNNNSNFNKINLNEYYLNTYLSKVKGLFNQINIHKWIIGGIGEVGNAQVTFNSELGMNKLTTNDIYCYSEDDNTTPQKCQKEDLEYPSKIGLMYVSDYAYAAKSEFWNQYMGGDEGYGSSTVREQNWLYMGLDEWTMSRLSTLGINPWHIVSWGRAGNYKASAANRSARPTFYLIADTKFASGDGTYSNPYRLFLT